MRLAGQIKMGYYPTPSGVCERLKLFLEFSKFGKTSAFDPCCGEGMALEMLCPDSNTVTYGIELDEARAKEAQGRLGKVIHAACEHVEIPPESMGLLLLNPPYDEGETERKELTFLREMMATLVRNGVLVYIIPRKRLTKDVADLLAANFSLLDAYRFPDGEYERFGQVVVLGTKNPWPTEPELAAKRLLDSLLDENLRPLETPPYPRFRVPISPECLMHKQEMSTEELAKLVARSPLQERLRTLLEPRELGELASPPTPLHVGHLGLLLAAGRLNGIVGKGPNRHIVVGKPERHVVESTDAEEDANGNKFDIQKRLETFRVAIKILRPTGEITKLV